jgi:hypothetical protein
MDKTVVNRPDVCLEALSKTILVRVLDLCNCEKPRGSYEKYKELQKDVKKVCKKKKKKKKIYRSNLSKLSS